MIYDLTQKEKKMHYTLECKHTLSSYVSKLGKTEYITKAKGGRFLVKCETSNKAKTD